MKKIYITLLIILLSTSSLSTSAELSLPEVSGELASTSGYQFLMLEHNLLQGLKQDPDSLSTFNKLYLESNREALNNWIASAISQLDALEHYSSSTVWGVPIPIAIKYSRMRLADIQREIARIHNGDTSDIHSASIRTYMSELKVQEDFWKKLLRLLNKIA